jgi:hypothetical protein
VLIVKPQHISGFRLPKEDSSGITDQGRTTVTAERIPSAVESVFADGRHGSPGRRAMRLLTSGLATDSADFRNGPDIGE